MLHLFWMKLSLSWQYTPRIKQSKSFLFVFGKYCYFLQYTLHTKQSLLERPEINLQKIIRQPNFTKMIDVALITIAIVMPCPKFGLPFF